MLLPKKSTNCFSNFLGYF